MSNAAFVLIAVAVIIVVSVLLWLLNRKPQTFMSSIDDFEREMKALGGETNKATKGAAAGRQRRRAISPSARGAGSGPDPGLPSTPPIPAGPTVVGNGASGADATGNGASGADATGNGATGADTSGEPQP